MSEDTAVYRDHVQRLQRHSSGLEARVAALEADVQRLEGEVTSRLAAHDQLLAEHEAALQHHLDVLDGCLAEARRHSGLLAELHTTQAQLRAWQRQLLLERLGNHVGGHLHQSPLGDHLGHVLGLADGDGTGWLCCWCAADAEA
jgi:hypothetical protein